MRTLDLATLVKARRELPSPIERRTIRVDSEAALADVADFVGVKKQTVALWEAGAREPSDENLLRYVEALRMMCDAMRIEPLTAKS